MDKVSILLSIYHPNPKYLEKQLLSLNEQDYPDLELLVWNDCPEEEIDHSLFNRCISRFPVLYFDEKTNLGYVKAFEKLCGLATGDYLSFCDQDDIWGKEKIRRCVEEIKAHNAVAAVCDRSLINAQGEQICESVRKTSKGKRFTWKTGDYITSEAAFFSYCTGMTLIARREEVCKFLPLDSELPHDQQLVFYLSAAGIIVNIEEPLVKQRIHGKNNSGTLIGVSRKKDYYHKRCIPVDRMLRKYETLYPDDPELLNIKKCSEARVKGSIINLFRYRHVIPDLYKYEIALSLCPSFIFKQYLRWKKNRF